MISMWIILGTISIVLSIIYWGGFGRKFGPNAVWGGLTLGLIMGFIVAIFSVFRGTGFDWFTIGKGGISGTILGFMAELLGSVSDYIKKKK